MKVRVQLVQDVADNVDTVIDSCETEDLDKDAAEELMATVATFLQDECKLEIFEVD